MKKEDNEDLLKLRIDVRTDDDMAYQEMAILLDKPEFLQMVPSLRETYKIQEMIEPSKFTDYYYDTYAKKYEEEKGRIYLDKYKRLEEFRRLFPDHYQFIKEESEKDWMSIRLDMECNIIAFEFRRPSYFADIVKQALFCNAVDDLFYIPTLACIIDQHSLGSTPASFPRPAILVSPTSTYEDVKENFQIIKSWMKTHKLLSYYQPRTDFVNNIRKYRHWYWERLKGKTLEKIADEWVESQLPKEDNTTYLEILKGVKIYEKLLKQ